MKMIVLALQVLGLYGLYQIGNFIQLTLHIEIPGNIIGMILLFLLLNYNIIQPKWIERGASLLLSNLPLLFIPVTVGIMDYAYLFKGWGALSLVEAFVGTLIVMGTSAYVSQLVAKKRETEKS